MSHNFKKSVLKQMENYGENIDLKALIRDYIEGLSIAHSEIRECLCQYAQYWDSILEKAIQLYAPEDPYKSTIGLCAVVKSEDHKYFDWIPVLSDVPEQRKYFEGKNKVLTNLTKRFLTSEIVGNTKT